MTELGAVRRVGIIGLGTMGFPLVEHLLNAGFEVRIHDVRPEPRETLAAAGAIPCDSVSDVARSSDVIGIVVVDDAQLAGVLDGTDGVLRNAARDSVVIIHSTASPAACVDATERARGFGIGVLDAPVSGGPTGAKAGSLTVLVGGDVEALDRARPMLAAYANHVIHVGPAGSGQQVKIINNLLSTINWVAVAEAIDVAAACGIERDRLFQVLAVSSGASWVTQHWAETMTQFVAAPSGIDGVREILRKDLLLAAALAEQHGLATPLGSTAANLVERVRP